MKISARDEHFFQTRRAARRGERGFLVIALLAIIAIMLIYVNVNLRLLNNLKRELKLVEQAQIQRLEKTGAQPLPLANTIASRATSTPVPTLQP